MEVDLYWCWLRDPGKAHTLLVQPDSAVGESLKCQEQVEPGEEG